MFMCKHTCISQEREQGISQFELPLEILAHERISISYLAFQHPFSICLHTSTLAVALRDSYLLFRKAISTYQTFMSIVICLFLKKTFHLSLRLVVYSSGTCGPALFIRTIQNGHHLHLHTIPVQNNAHRKI